MLTINGMAGQRRYTIFPFTNLFTTSMNVSGFNASRKRVGSPLKPGATLAPNHMLSRTRATRRNLARMTHGLHAWKLPRNHARITGTGQIYVPFPLMTTTK